MNKLVDCHAHILDEYYPDDKNEILNNNEDIVVIINGVDLDSNYEILKTINEKNDVYGALGIHPTDVDKHSISDLEKLFKNIENEKVIAIGETGIDLYWNKSNFEKQKQFFEYHIEVAQKFKIPVIIHSRGAEKEVYEILKKYDNVKSILHCYGGDLATANKFIKLGSMIGIGGVVTFKNAKELQQIVKEIDIKNIITETDSPYLSPEPFRGKKNEPKNVKFIVNKIASIKGLDPKEVKEEIYNNFVREFDLK